MSPLDYFHAYALRYQPYKAGAWCYEDGCLYRGLQLLYEADPQGPWLGHLVRLVDGQIDRHGKLKSYDPSDYNIDNILPGRVLFFLAAQSGDNRYRRAADRLIAQLETHPRLLAGNYWHKKRYPHQLWLDGLYMGLPFQIEYGMDSGREGLIADALQQLATALVLTDHGSGLFVHGYDESRIQAWCDRMTGKSPAVWARAVGWLVMALADTLSLVEDDEAITSLRRRFCLLLGALVERQEESGLWMQVLEAPGLSGNYQESSATAMFAYALLRAARLGLVEEGVLASMQAAGERALQGLLQTRLQADEGVLRLTGIVQVAGLGGFEGQERDGSPAYYLREPVVSDDVKGVGPLMMAYSEHMRL
ncbi:glycoside hydrolase family 88/105 protein [Allorhizobium undicola]|uniref:glycoside hydrolase family 88/105 protein n=1 Tax=Allorhizobium undicola TaxID=78527 RepID=UPI0004867189|nr:glycoside hydrolase family 88 protein [Allorhizobium undicola]